MLFNMIFANAALLLDDLVVELTGYDQIDGVVFTLYLLAVLIPTLAVTVRRVHDIGKSGWILLVAGVIPVLGLLYIAGLMVLKGESRENKYGADPKNPDPAASNEDSRENNSNEHNELFGKTILNKENFLEDNSTKIFTFKRLVIIIALILFGAFVVWVIDEMNDDDVVAEFAKEAANEFNPPVMINDTIRLDDIKVESGRKLTYLYTFIDYVIDKDNAKSRVEHLLYLEDEWKPETFNHIATSSELEALRKVNTTFVYVFRDKLGDEIAKFEFLPDDYK